MRTTRSQFYIGQIYLLIYVVLLTFILKIIVIWICIYYIYGLHIQSIFKIIHTNEFSEQIPDLKFCLDEIEIIIYCKKGKRNQVNKIGVIYHWNWLITYTIMLSIFCFQMDPNKREKRCWIISHKELFLNKFLWENF